MRALQPSPTVNAEGIRKVQNSSKVLSSGGSCLAARKLLPILEWIPAYRRKWLLPDVLAGVALWAVTVPEGMA